MAEKKKWREESVETPKPPLVDEAFRKPALTSVTIEERRKWEAMFARFHEPHSRVLTQAQAASVIQVTNYINEVVTPASECYWVKVADDVHYLEGDVYCAYGVNAQHAVLSDPTASSYLKLINPTDEERDTYIQHSVGADPIQRWTHGLDDSLGNDWLLCAGDILTDAVTEETYELDIALDTFLLICDCDNSRIQKWLRADGTYLTKVGTYGTGNDQFENPWGICSDGTWVYVTDRVNDRVVKRLLSDLSYVAQIGSHGSGNDNFNDPRGICTDGTWLYVVDTYNNRVVKRLCSDLSYVSETAGPGFNVPQYICTDGTHIYTVQTPGATYRIFKHYCDTLSLDTRVMPAGTDGHIDSITLAGICTTGGYLYITNSNEVVGSSAVYKYSCADLTWVSQFGTNGDSEAHTEVYSPAGIATDGTYLYISDSYSTVYARILIWQLDGTFVAHYGVYGNEASESGLDTPRGIALSGQITRRTITPRRGPILRAKADASACEAYVSFQFRDECRFRENSVANLNYIGLRAPASVTSYDLILPGAQSTGAQFLRNDGTGVLSWVTALTSVTAHNLLSATHGDTLTASVVKGAIPYGNATPKWGALAPNTTATKKWLYETSSVPDWGIIEAADLPAHQLDGAVHSVSGLTTGHFLKATGATTFGFAAHGLTASSVGAEPALGNPATTGFVLSSTDAGVRSWVANASTFVALTDGPGVFTGHGGQFVKVNVAENALEYIASSVAGHALGSASHTDVDAAAPSDNDILRFDTASGTWKNEALPAASNHDLLSASHGDTTAAAVQRGDIIIGSGASPNTKWTRLAKGTLNYVLTMGADEPVWAEATGGGAPTDAKYIVQEANGSLSAEQSLGALATGILKNTTTAAVGVLSIATGADIPARPLSITTITATGATNWNKVAGATWCLVKIWAGGGSGGRGGSGDGGGGGGGGSYIEKIFNYADLSDPVSVTIGAGGAAQTSDDTAGNVGGNTTFGAYLTAYGGGGGGAVTSVYGGGGGGGTNSVGSVGTGSAGGVGGGPGGGYYTATTGVGRHSSFGGGSGGGAGPIAAGDSGWGGGGGGGGTATSGNGVGGNSLFGGGGGGGGSDTGTGSAGGSSVFGGAGGAGTTDVAAGVAGTQPGGGGGGSENANSGKGGDGQAIIISF